MSDGGKMPLPPSARRLDVAATRAAFAAGTLGAVRDDAANGDVQGDGVMAQPDRAHGDGVALDSRIVAQWGKPYARAIAPQLEHVRQSRLKRWQTR